MSNTEYAALYVRVSTEEQAIEGYSIQAQIDALESYAQQNNLHITTKYIDGGASGKSISGRPEMKRLLQDINAKKFSTILVYKLDRVARKLKDALEIAERCEQANVRLISLKENFDLTNPIGKVLFQLMGSFSEFERNSILERGKMGMIQRAKEGYFNGGRVLGYESVNKLLVVNEEEARIVRLIFELAEQELGYKAIVSRVNGLGYKTKQGKHFSINTIKTILDNPIYIGKIRFNLHSNWAEKHRKGKNDDYILVQGKHDAIISEEQWNLIQKLRKKRSIKPAQSKTPFILSGLIKCPKCGYGMVPSLSKGSKGEKYRYYVCGLFHNKGKHACSAHSIRAERAEQQVHTELKRIVKDPFILKRIIDKLNQTRSEAKNPLVEEMEILQSKLNKINTRINNITNNLMDDTSLISFFKPKLVDLSEEKTITEERIEELKSDLDKCDTSPIDVSALHNLVSSFETVLADASSEKQKALLRLIIKDIQINLEASRKVGRQVERINLHFDFTIDGLMDQTFDLLNTVSIENIMPVEPWMLENDDGKSISEVMASLNILPLKDVRFTPINPKSPIHLLQQY